MNQGQSTASQTVFGHPAPLFTLFFAEMWERFSFYGMRSLLVFYMMKGFLGYGDKDAYAIYGFYTSLVYMTPFFGGMLADRLLGPRRAVIFGGLLIAGGQALLTIPSEFTFFTGLGLLVCGNGFFKPNISTIVGSLYAQGNPRRDGGFTIFYMGVNLGAAISPLLCGYIGETFGWNKGFGLAAVGMLTGIVVFVAPSRVTQIVIAAAALATAAGLLGFHPDNPFSIGVNVFVAIALLAAAAVALLALQRGGLPRQAGAPRDPQRLRRPVLGWIRAEWAVYLAVLVLLPIVVLLVSGFAPLSSNGRPVALIPEAVVENMKSSGGGAVQVLADVLREMSRPAGLVLMLAGLFAFGYIGVETFRLDKIPRERMYVVLILTFFSMLFWSFFEQAGTSLNNFTDRNVNRVSVQRRISAEDVGNTIPIQPTQAQLGYHNGGQLFTLNILNRLREEHEQEPNFEIQWKVAEDNVDMGIANRGDEIPASTFQSVNAIYILIFGLIFTALWSVLATRGLEPSTPVKFAMGLLQLGLGFAAFWYGAQTADQRGMVALGWLFVGYLLHTTGELCLSPVGLSMITKLSPARLVSTVMGIWFLATAFSQFLAAIIAQFTGVTHGGEGKDAIVPPPVDTVHVYGDVFGKIAVSAVISAMICLALSPMLSRWMHPEADARAEPEGP